MTLEETRKRILEDDEFVLSEANRLTRLYKLKRVIRAAQKRLSDIDTESVAEHIFGMHVLANYFLPLEDTEGKWGKLKILETITWHDMDEIEIGDIMAHIKTDEDRKRAEESLKKELDNLPEVLKDEVNSLMHQYEGKETIEARFVRAIDKLEPAFEAISANGFNKMLHDLGVTLEKHWAVKRPHIKDFPYITRFTEVLTEYLDKNNYFPR